MFNKLFYFPRMSLLLESFCMQTVWCTHRVLARKLRVIFKSMMLVELLDSSAIICLKMHVLHGFSTRFPLAAVGPQRECHFLLFSFRLHFHRHFLWYPRATFYYCLRVGAEGAFFWSLKRFQIRFRFAMHFRCVFLWPLDPWSLILGKNREKTFF